MEEKDETLQQPSESDESASAPETEQIEEMKAVADDSATEENKSPVEEDNISHDDAPPELSAAEDDETQDQNVSETVSAEAAFAPPAVPQPAEPEFSEFQFSDEELKTLPGPILYKIYPHRFDNRLVERQRTGLRPEQWDGYIGELPCALCGVPGGKCDCQIEGDTKAYQKITWSY